MKTAAKVLGAILGFLMVFIGIWCMALPGETFLAIGWLIGLAMLIDGIGNVINFFSERKKTGTKGILSIIFGILGIVIGALLLVNIPLQFFMDQIILYLLIAWLIVGGVFRIVGAFKLKSLGAEAPDGAGKTWWLVLILGILLIVLGIFCAFHPIITAITAGLFAGIAILVAGISLISAAFAVDHMPDDGAAAA